MNGVCTSTCASALQAVKDAVDRICDARVYGDLCMFAAYLCATKLYRQQKGQVHHKLSNFASSCFVVCAWYMLCAAASHRLKNACLVRVQLLLFIA